MLLRRFCPTLICAILLAACGGDSPSDVVCSRQTVNAPSLGVQPGPFADDFAAAAQEFDVSAALLVAIAYTETRFQMVEGHEEFGGQPAAWGVMALRGERLIRGARLAGVSLDQARSDVRSNVRAAAALIDALADESAIDRSEPAQWKTVIERFSGIELQIGREAYFRDVARALPAAGAIGGRPMVLPPECPAPGGPITPPPVVAAPDYTAALWRASPNFNTRQAGEGGVPQMVIIHTCEGAYSGCWSWLINPVSQVSAHYVVNEDGSEISQLVAEPQRAWHIGATYDCALNRRRKCSLTGVQSNHFTIGVEHGGFASQSSFPEGQLNASARLVCDITRDNNIPRDWQHIVAHGQLQPQNRTDPGPNWPWISYLHRIQKHCGETVVDDESANSDPDLARSTTAPNWFASDSTAGFYGTGYHWAATTTSASEPHRFHFRTESAGSRTIEARWTSGGNRSAAATFRIIASTGDTLATRALDQRTGGDQWQTIGSVTLPVGWHRVELSREGPAGSVVVADAVRVR